MLAANLNPRTPLTVVGCVCVFDIDLCTVPQTIYRLTNGAIATFWGVPVGSVTWQTLSALVGSPTAVKETDKAKVNRKNGFFSGLEQLVLVSVSKGDECDRTSIVNANIMEIFP